MILKAEFIIHGYYYLFYLVTCFKYMSVLMRWLLKKVGQIKQLQ